MESSNFEQISLDKSLLGESELFLQDNMVISIEFVDNKAVSIRLPENITETVVETEAVIKGQTAASSFKPAILSNGYKIMVPAHIESGTRIVISSSSFTYVEKSKD